MLPANWKALLQIALYTGLLFGLFTFGSLLDDSRAVGFPFWFEREACAISVNPATGQMSSVDYENDWLHLALDVLVAFVPAFLFYKWRSRRAARAH